jgi:hypothetical protein
MGLNKGMVNMNIRQTIKKYKICIICYSILGIIIVCAILTQYISLYLLLFVAIILSSYFSDNLGDWKQPENDIYIIAIFIMILPFFIGFLMLVFTRDIALQIKHIKGDQWVIIFSALIAYLGTTSLGYLAYLQNKRLNKINSDLAQNAEDKSNREITYFESVKANYLFQINAEMLINSQFYVSMLYYYFPNQQALKYEALKIFMEHISDTAWIHINSEAAKYLPKEIMEDIVGYYAGVNQIKTFWLIRIRPSLDVKPLKNLIKGQLQTYLKCLQMMEQELGSELRKEDKYFFDGNYFKINKETGDIEHAQ